MDELVDDFLALRRDGRVPAWRSLEAGHGALEFCGDEVHLTLTFVGSDGLTPGSYTHLTRPTSDLG